MIHLLIDTGCLPSIASRDVCVFQQRCNGDKLEYYGVDLLIFSLDTDLCHLYNIFLCLSDLTEMLPNHYIMLQNQQCFL